RDDGDAARVRRLGRQHRRGVGDERDGPRHAQRLSGTAGILTARPRLRGYAPITTRGALMRVVIAGGHGQIALQLEKVLADRGDAPVGIVRNPDHVEDLEKAVAEAVVLDLESADVDT